MTNKVINERNSEPDYQSLAKQFWQQGYVHIRGFFDDEMMTHYNESILGHFGFEPGFEHTDEFLQRAEVEVVPWFPQREGVKLFDKVGLDSRFKKLTDAILDSDWYEQYSMVMFSKEGTKGQAWHQDCLPEDKRRFNMNRLIYTMDINKQQTGGQTLVMPGSHLKGMLPSVSEPFEESKCVTLSPCKGDVVFLHGHCWHSVMPVTGQYRVSTNYRCAPQGTPEDITDIGVYRNILYQFSTQSVVSERS